MQNQTNKVSDAIDLMLEDLHIKHNDIREQAKECGCEKELDALKQSLIEYLYEIKERL